MPTSLTLRHVRPVTSPAQNVARHAFPFHFARRQRVGRGVVLDRTIVHALIAPFVARATLAHLIVESEARAPQAPRMTFAAHGLAGQSAQRGAPLFQRSDPFVIVTVRAGFVLVQASLLNDTTHICSRFRKAAPLLRVAPRLTAPGVARVIYIYVYAYNSHVHARKRSLLGSTSGNGAANTHHRSVGIEDGFVTRPAPVRANRVVRTATAAHAIHVTRQTHAGPGLASAVLVHRTLRHAMHTVPEIPAFRTMFGTGPVATAVAFRMARRARFVAGLVQSDFFFGEAQKTIPALVYRAECFTVDAVNRLLTRARDCSSADTCCRTGSSRKTNTVAARDPNSPVSNTRGRIFRFPRL